MPGPLAWMGIWTSPSEPLTGRTPIPAGQERTAGTPPTRHTQDTAGPITQELCTANTRQPASHGHHGRDRPQQVLLGSANVVLNNSPDLSGSRTHMWSRFHVLKRTRLSRLP